MREKRIVRRFALEHILTFIPDDEAQIWFFPAIRRLPPSKEVAGFSLAVDPRPCDIRLDPRIGEEVYQGPGHRIAQGLSIISEHREGTHSLDWDQCVIVMVQVC